MLNALPAGIVGLEKLTTLDLNGNRLTALPQHMDQLRSLRTLYLQENVSLATLDPGTIAMAGRCDIDVEACLRLSREVIDALRAARSRQVAS